MTYWILFYVLIAKNDEPSSIHVEYSAQKHATYENCVKWGKAFQEVADEVKSAPQRVIQFHCVEYSATPQRADHE
jgi:hypothetical protein